MCERARARGVGGTNRAGFAGEIVDFGGAGERKEYLRMMWR